MRERGMERLFDTELIAYIQPTDPPNVGQKWKQMTLVNRTIDRNYYSRMHTSQSIQTGLSIIENVIARANPFCSTDTDLTSIMWVIATSGAKAFILTGSYPPLTD